MQPSRQRFLRPIWVSHRLWLEAHGELYNAFSFKRHAAAGMRAEWQAWPSIALRAGLGARATSTRFEPLERRIGRFSPTWEAGLVVRERITLSWSYNEFGTEAQHFTIGYDVQRKAKPSRG